MKIEDLKIENPFPYDSVISENNEDNEWRLRNNNHHKIFNEGVSAGQIKLLEYQIKIVKQDYTTGPVKKALLKWLESLLTGIQERGNELGCY